MSEERYLTTEEAAERLNLAIITVQKYCKNQLLAGARKAGTGHRAPYLIPESSVKNFEKPKRGRPAKQAAIEE